MKTVEKQLLIRAFQGEAQAFRELAMILDQAAADAVTKELVAILLTQGILAGDEESYFVKQKLFPNESPAVDPDSKAEMTADYDDETDASKKEKLEKYIGI